VKIIARVFYINAESGLARNEYTRDWFNPLRGATIIYIATCIYWAIKEYETGTRRSKGVRFDGPEVDSKYKSL